MAQYALKMYKTNRGEFVLSMIGSKADAAIENGGKTVKEAATWLLRHAHRLLEETEGAILDSGILTDAEVEAIALDDERVAVAREVAS